MHLIPISKVRCARTLCFLAAAWVCGSTGLGQGYLAVTGPSALRFGFSASDRGCFSHLRPPHASTTNSPPVAVSASTNALPIIEAAWVGGADGHLPGTIPTLDEPGAGTADAGPMPASGKQEPATIAAQAFVQFFMSGGAAGTNRQAIATLPLVFDPPRPPSALSSSATYTSQ